MEGVLNNSDFGEKISGRTTPRWQHSRLASSGIVNQSQELEERLRIEEPRASFGWINELKKGIWNKSKIFTHWVWMGVWLFIAPPRRCLFLARSRKLWRKSRWWLVLLTILASLDFRYLLLTGCVLILVFCLTPIFSTILRYLLLLHSASFHWALWSDLVLTSHQWWILKPLTTDYRILSFLRPTHWLSHTLLLLARSKPRILAPQTAPC